MIPFILCLALFSCLHGDPAEVLFRIPEPGLIPESIAFDPISGDYFLGSIREGRIIRIAPDGKYRDFAPSREYGLLSVLGMKVDSRRRLWACNNASPSLGVGERPEPLAGVTIFDIDSGRVLGSVHVDQLNDRHFFNDLAFDAADNAYITGFNCPYIYRVDAETYAIETWFTMPDRVWCNGIAFSPDHSVLFIAGNDLIYRLDMETRTLATVQPPAGEQLGYADGLYCYGNSLIAVQYRRKGEGVSCRIARSYLDATMTVVERMEVLAEDLPEFRSPTTGVIVGDQFILIATSHLEALDDGHGYDPSKSGDVLIMTFDLK